MGPYPSWRRTLAGFVVAPLVAVLPLILINLDGRISNMVMAMLFGGAGSAALPWLLAAPWLGGAVLLVIILALPFGAVGGGVFWLVACRGTPGLPLVAADVAEG